MDNVRRVAVRCGMCHRLIRHVVVAHDRCFPLAPWTEWVDSGEAEPAADGVARGALRAASHRLAATCTVDGDRLVFACAGRRHRAGAKLHRVLREETLHALCVQALGRRDRADLLL